MLSIDIQFMLDEEKTSILDMAPKRPDTTADMVIIKCVRNRLLNALFLSWSCLVHTSYRFTNEK